jgi:ribose transport system substrate-binding protein
MFSRNAASRRGSRSLAAAAVLAAGALAAACGSEDSAETATAGEEQQIRGKVAIGTSGSPKEFISIEKVCGEQPMTVAYADGAGGNAWRKIVRAEFEDEARKCPNVEKVLYTDAQGNPQKAISDLNGLVAQGADVIVAHGDAGEALLPAVRNATRKGVKYVPILHFPGGKPGKDFVDYVAESNEAQGETWAQWMIKTLKGKGNIVFLGGTPGNPLSEAEAVGIRRALAEAPGVKLLEGPVDTNWDPAQTQKVMAGLLAKYKKIDGVISDYGGGAVGAIRAFVQANRPLVPFVANDSNGWACMYARYKKSNPGFEMASTSSRTWIIRPGLRKGVAAFQGTSNPEPSRIELPIIEDSTAGNPPKCDRDLPPDAILSTGLAPRALASLFGAS